MRHQLMRSDLHFCESAALKSHLALPLPRYGNINIFGRPVRSNDAGVTHGKFQVVSQLTAVFQMLGSISQLFQAFDYVITL